MTLLGLVGLTIIVSISKVFRPLRVWLKKRRPPLRWFGELLSCSMCTGFWAGLAWGLRVGDWERAMLWAGVVSVCSYAASSVLLWLEGLTRERD